MLASSRVCCVDYGALGGGPLTETQTTTNRHVVRQLPSTLTDYSGMNPGGVLTGPIQIQPASEWQRLRDRQNSSSKWNIQYIYKAVETVRTVEEATPPPPRVHKNHVRLNTNETFDLWPSPSRVIDVKKEKRPKMIASTAA